MGRYRGVDLDFGFYKQGIMADSRIDFDFMSSGSSGGRGNNESLLNFTRKPKASEVKAPEPPQKRSKKPAGSRKKK